MWTPEDRASAGDFGAGQALSDDRYRRLEPFIPAAESGGRPRKTDVRRVLDAPFYLVRTGCQWRHLPPPPAFPPRQTVYGCLRAFLAACRPSATSLQGIAFGDGVWEGVRHHLVVMPREGEGREAGPSAAVVDTRSPEA